MSDISAIRACTPRFLPSEDASEAIKVALKENPNNAIHYSHAPLAGGITPATNVPMGDEPQMRKLGLFVQKMWRPGRTLRVLFRGGSTFVRSKVMQYANLWSQYANIRFVVVSSLPAEIRINFDEGRGSWSYIGTDSLWVSDDSPTINFGWFTDKTVDETFSRTTIHEFGHALGCIHEQQQPKASISWNKPVVYDYYYRTQGWSKEEVDSYVFDQYSSDDVSSSSYDPESVMHYPVPEEFTTNVFSIGWNKELSIKDIAFIQRMYPETRVTSTGVFNTMSVRPWNQPAQDNQFTIEFTEPNSSPPTVLLGLNWLDISNEANLRINAHVEEMTSDLVRINLFSWGDTVQYASGCAWLRVPHDDHDVQHGQFSTEDDHPWCKPQKSTSRRITFAYRYATPPTVVVWLNALDIDKDANFRVKAYASDVTPEGFTIHIDSWSNTVLYMARATWVAYPADRKDICSGSFNTSDIRPSNKPRPETSGKTLFKSHFADVPRVFMALNYLDIDRRANVRVRLSISDISTESMTWHLDSWADTTLYGAGASFIAWPMLVDQSRFDVACSAHRIRSPLNFSTLEKGWGP